MLRSLLSAVRCSFGKPGLLSQTHRSLYTQALVRGPNEPPLLNQTVGQHFAGIVSEHGDRTAYVPSCLSLKWHACVWRLMHSTKKCYIKTPAKDINIWWAWSRQWSIGQRPSKVGRKEGRKVCCQSGKQYWICNRESFFGPAETLSTTMRFAVLRKLIPSLN